MSSSYLTCADSILPYYSYYLTCAYFVLASTRSASLRSTRNGAVWSAFTSRTSCSSTMKHASRHGKDVSMPCGSKALSTARRDHRTILKWRSDVVVGWGGGAIGAARI